MPARASRSRFPVCGRTFDGDTCPKRGEHYCQPRADHVVAFFTELLVHTKARWARQAFRLAPWQEHDILRPLFGTVRWDEQAGQYVRRYRLAYISMARKCGKSEIAAGICLYLLCADGEEGAEIYGAALDKDQARKVFDVAARMVKLSPVLSRRLVVKDHVKRIVDEQTGSYYEAIPADAGGNLGHNPHGAVYDELLTAPNGDLWNALRTGAGTRTQPLMVAITTAGNNRDSFCYQEYLEAKRVLENPQRAPHRFAYLAEAPADADPWDEATWKQAPPALGDFLSVQTLREEASEAREDPARENVFRQFRLNQWVSQVSRWVPMDLYDSAAGEPWPSPEWRLPVGRPLAYGGLDVHADDDGEIGQDQADVEYQLQDRHHGDGREHTQREPAPQHQRQQQPERDGDDIDGSGSPHQAQQQERGHHDRVDERCVPPQPAPDSAKHPLSLRSRLLAAGLRGLGKTAGVAPHAGCRPGGLGPEGWDVPPAYQRSGPGCQSGRSPRSRIA